MKKIFQLSTHLKYLLISLIIGILISILYLTNSFYRYENVFSDFILRTMVERKKTSSKIVYAVSNQRSIREAKKYYRMGWPWKRSMYSKLVNYLNLCGAQFIIFNIIFSEESFDNPQEDQIFAQAVHSAKNVIFPFFFPFSKKNNNKNPNPGLKRFSLKDLNSFSNLKKYNDILFPIEPLLNSAQSIGFDNIDLDFDNTLRRSQLIAKYNHQVYPSLGLSAILKLFPDKKITYQNGNLYYNNQFIPLDDKGHFRLKYYGDNSIYKDYYHIDMIRIYDYINKLYEEYKTLKLSPPITYPSLYQNTRNILQLRKVISKYNPKLVEELPERLLLKTPVEAFQKKIVIVGTLAPGIFVPIPTPFNHKESGIHIHATLINNFMNGDFLVEYDSRILKVIIILIVTLLTGYIISKSSSIKGILLSILIIILLTAIPFVLIKYNILLSTLSINIAVLSTFIVVSLRKLLDELRDNIYIQLVKVSPIGIIIHQQGKILFANQSAYHILRIINGTSIENTLFVDYIDQNSAKLFTENMSKLEKGDIETDRSEYKMQSDNKDELYIKSHSIQFNYQRNPAMETVIQDISDLKRIEKIERKLNALLDRRNEELIYLNNELKSFAHIVSHDLKAPLRGINAISQWIYEDYSDKLDDNGKEQLQLMSDKVKEMRKLIDAILQYSRAGQIITDKSLVDLNTLVSTTIELLSPPDTMKIHIDNRLPTIFCEETKIGQVFQNLIGNGIKYIDKPVGEIHISSKQENNHYLFIISDNGPGIPEEFYEQIFQIFNKVNKNENIDSSGVGLSIVKKIIEQHGGKIWVDSKIAEGSRFLFTLPIHSEESV